jgi:hypothetical protein
MRVLRLKERYPTAKVELWCEDEHRLGLSAYPETGVLEKMSWAQARWMSPR